MLVIPNGGIDRVTQLHPQTPAAPAAPHGQSPESAALSYAITHRLTQPGDQATLTVTAGGQTHLFGAEVKGSGSASISVTYKGGGDYEVTLSQTQEAGAKVASGDGEDPKPSDNESGKPRPAGIPVGIVLGPGFGDNRPPGETLPPATGVVPVTGPGFTGITAPRVGIFAQAKPPQQEEGSGGQVVGVTTPGPSSVQSNPSISAESTVDVTSTVTVLVHGPGNAVSAANAFAVMAGQPRPGSFVDNPIMDQINGKSGNVAGVSPATLDFLEQHVESYGETITGSGTVVAGLKTSFGKNSLSELNLDLQNSQQVSLSRTVTMPTRGTPGNPATPGNVAYAVSAQTSIQPTSTAFGTSSSEQGSQQVSFTQTFNLNTKADVANPEHALTVENRWLKPDEVQQTIQTQVQLVATVSLPKGSSAGDSRVRTTTITATLQIRRPGDLEHAAQSFQSNPTQPGSNFSVSHQTTTVDNSTISVGGDWPINGSLTFSRPE